MLYEVKKVIVGQDHLLERMLVALLARGHILVEGVPGLAKTMAIKTLAEAIGGEFKRIQFTPDLVPADLVGTRIYNQKTGEFNTSLGPVFTNLLLADEINRAPAKVQSALLEVMQERQVTIGRETFKVPDPFLVLATQNPIETEGTYALPEAQVDRFMLKVLVGYPIAHRGVCHRRAHDRLPGKPCRRCSPPSSCWSCRRRPTGVYVDPALIEYAVRLVTATRQPEEFGLKELRALHPVRRQPARLDQPDPDRAGAGLCARAQLCPAAGCAGHGAGCDAPSPGAFLRGAVGQCDQRRPAEEDSWTAFRSRWCRCMNAMPERASREPSRTPERILQRLDWQVIRRLDGLLQGDYRSLFYGYGVDFADLREYQPGDDIRYIDWNVTARMDTPYVRQYIEDREITAWFLLDLSPSMDFGTVAAPKSGRC